MYGVDEQHICNHACSWSTASAVGRICEILASRKWDGGRDTLYLPGHHHGGCPLSRWRLSAKTWGASNVDVCDVQKAIVSLAYGRAKTSKVSTSRRLQDSKTPDVRRCDTGINPFTYHGRTIGIRRPRAAAKQLGAAMIPWRYDAAPPNIRHTRKIPSEDSLTRGGCGARAPPLPNRVRSREPCLVSAASKFIQVHPSCGCTSYTSDSEGGYFRGLDSASLHEGVIVNKTPSSRASSWFCVRLQIAK